MNSITALFELHRMRGNLHVPLESLERQQLLRLRQTLCHAYSDVPFYRELMDEAGLRPDRIHSRHDFCEFPVSSRTTYYGLPEAARWSLSMRAAGTPFDARHTSGTLSGKPTLIPVTASEAAWRALVVIRADLENGYRLWHRQAFIQRPPMRADRWFKRFGILPSVYCSLFDDPASQVETLLRFRPQRLCGQPSALLRAARTFSNLGQPPPAIPLLVTFGERLTPSHRQLLESCFQGRVFHRYGISEAGIVGWECEHHRGYHLNIEDTLLECLRDGKPAAPGHVGELVLTNLRNRIRPLIRVKTGDMGRLEASPCGCGRTLPLLAEVLGRSDEFLRTPTGTPVSPVEVESIFESHPELDWRIVQKRKDLVDLLGATEDANLLEGLAQILRQRFELEVKIKCVSIFPQESSGKVRRVRNLLEIKATEP